MSNCKEVFTEIYRTKKWGDGSGGGSTPDAARPYCVFVSFYLAHLGIVEWEKTPCVLDIGCGDGVVAQGIDFTNWRYIGVDAAQGIDALTDPLPDADLVLCKEVLQHLSNAQVQLLLERTDHYKRRLFTSMTGPGVNVDIQTGDSRPVDLTLPPFNRPARTVLTYGKDAKWIVQELTKP